MEIVKGFHGAVEVVPFFIVFQTFRDDEEAVRSLRQGSDLKKQETSAPRSSLRNGRRGICSFICVFCLDG